MSSTPPLPELPRVVPRRRLPVGRRIGSFVLRLLGWKWEGSFPNLDRSVLIAWPHTSNWDGIIGLSALMACEIGLRFYGKKQLFWPPMGWFLRKLGGIPVDRANPQGVVETAIQRFGRNDPFILDLMPEGTREPGQGWRSGFHRIANSADVPICVVALDYGVKKIRLLGSLHPTDDLNTDHEKLNRLLRNVKGSARHGQRILFLIRNRPNSRTPLLEVHQYLHFVEIGPNLLA